MTASARPHRRGVPPRAVLAIGAATLILVVLYLGRDALAPFVVGLLFVYVLDPLVRRVAERGLPRWLAILVVYGAVLSVLVVGLSLLLGPLVAQLGLFAARLPDLLRLLEERLDALVSEGGPGVLADVARWLHQLATVLEQGGGTGAALPDLSGLLPLASGLAGTLRTLLAYLLVPIFAFWVLKDREALMEDLRHTVPEPYRDDGTRILALVERVFGRWLRGQLVLCLVVGVATFVGLMALGILIDPAFERFAILLAVIAGLLEFLPIIGPIISMVPGLLVAVALGRLDAALAVLILYTLVQQVENHVLVPIIQGDAVDLHPAVVIFALTVGGAIAGLLGAVLALPVTAAGRDVYAYLETRLAVADGTPTLPAGLSPGLDPTPGSDPRVDEPPR